MNCDRETPSDPALVNQPALYQEVAQGLAYLHHRTNATSERALEAAAFIYALIELLMEKGLLSLDEIDDRKKQVTKQLLKRYMQYDPGIAIQEPAQDKYAFPQSVQIDCENRVHLCKAACCQMVFPLSRQDIEEGVIKWDLSKPYIIAKGVDGYCHHFDRQCLSCTVQ